MKRLTVYQIDAFTKEKFKGNPAGVVVNADRLNEQQMQLIARELNNSETAFLFSPDDANCDGVIRYFTPTREVPICGHATIGAMYAKALEENLASCVLRMKTQVGILPFEVVKEEGDYRIIMTQGPIEIQEPFEESITNRIIQALGLSQEDLDRRCPVQIASTGHSKVMIGIGDRNKLNNLTPNFRLLSEISNEIHCNGFFVFTLDSNNPDILTHGRMFAPAIGINEDPVTGNANGPLGAYLVHNRIVDHNNKSFLFKGQQGEAINRSGVMEIRVTIENNQPQLVQIAGYAVVAFRTYMDI